VEEEEVTARAIMLSALLALPCSSGVAEERVPAVGSNCSLAAATPIANDAATAWEVAKGLRSEDRLNITALITARRVLVLDSKAIARVLANDQGNFAQKIRVLAPLGEGKSSTRFATRT
jgi:hypothetical protein